MQAAELELLAEGVAATATLPQLARLLIEDKFGLDGQEAVRQHIIVVEDQAPVPGLC